MNDLKIGLVTTVRGVGSEFADFIEYHQSIGISRQYIFMDDPDEQCNFDNRTVTVTVNSPSLRRRYATLPGHEAHINHIDTEVMARQSLNATMAIQMAKADKIDWLLHIDSDELFYPSTAAALQHVFLIPEKAGYQQIRFLNHEAIPEAETIDSPFREVTCFRVSPAVLPGESTTALPFLGYDNGKSAIRVSDDVAGGVHRFFPLNNTPLKTIVSTSAFILHYINCGLDRYHKKYEMLGNFKDKWYGNRDIKIRFHLKSRDEICREGLAGARRLYRSSILLPPDQLETALKSGAAQQIEFPKKLLISATDQRY